MPVPVRETPIVRHWLAEGRAEGRREAVVALTSAMLCRRFGEDPRVPDVAERLAGITDDERLARIDEATALDDLV